MSNSSSLNGIGFTGLLTIVFIVLKLLGKISWSWLWVLSPIWIVLSLAIMISMVRIEKLQKIAYDMRGQDNRITADPIFMVQQRQRIYGLHPDWSEYWTYLDDEGEEIEAGESEAAKVGYIDIWINEQPFFSEKAAQFYIDFNRHYLTDPRIYVKSAWRNYEWQAVLEVLSDLQ